MNTPTPTSWLSSLPADTAARFSSLGHVESLAPGERLITQHTGETHLFLIEEGEVEVPQPGSAAVTLGRHDLVGEMAFIDNTPRRNDVFARTAVRVRRIERTELVNAFLHDPLELRSVLDAIVALKQARLTHHAGHQDEAAEFVSRLAEESLRHRAVDHPYLHALESGSLPDVQWALADFARHYYFYSSHFPRYLTTVISRLEDPGHRRALMDNLTEESGTYGEEELQELAKFGCDPEWFVGIPHPLLFRRFSLAVGVTPDPADEHDQVICWRDMFLAVLGNGSPAEALGALGLGTENIVRTIYGPFVKAIDRLGTLDPRDTVFFPLHTAVDDHHQATLQAISADYARTPEGRSGLRRGMLKSLSLRSAFWDWLHARAMQPAAAESVL